MDEADDILAAEGNLRAKIMKRPGEALEDFGECLFDENAWREATGQKPLKKVRLDPIVETVVFDSQNLDFFELEAGGMQTWVRGIVDL